ncbi:SH3 domain-containing protein [Bacillus sp. FJAT-49736]|uniref:SH3 domain-containing protein n=1 Tax=Bacillus sp. FJAT-49736 TaxID=2833582 RepID=UPI001BC90554|nr:SH3 domain-containing protein [Bacillus sp. FJAT-49736]MBS4174228.1 hypothetical protein [Bacillus sp. FJAT-49736]
MKKLRYLLVSLLSIAITFGLGHITAKPAEAASKSGTITATVKVYSSYSTHSKVIGKKSKGNKVSVLASKKGFSQIKFGKKTGWVLTKNIKLQNANDPSCSLKEFNQIRNGMTISQVRAIIGSNGTLTAEASAGGFTSKIYQFKGNTEFSSVAISFMNGKVSAKSQVGLK